MDNPAYFTVLSRTDSAFSTTPVGLRGSRRSALYAAASHRNCAGPDTYFDVAVVTLLEQDPASGTPVPHFAPVVTAGYALASLSAADPEHRSLHGLVYSHLEVAQLMARHGRSRNQELGNDEVLDIVALTIIDHDPAAHITVNEATVPDREN